MTDEMRGLIERIEQATADTQDLLILEAWLLTNPEPPRDWKPLPKRCADVTDEQRVKMRMHSDWRAEKARITLLLANGGFIDAAMTLIAPDAFKKVAVGSGTKRAFAQLIHHPGGPFGGIKRPSIYVTAANPALALCAAALKALSTIEGHGDG